MANTKKPDENQVAQTDLASILAPPSWSQAAETWTPKTDDEIKNIISGAEQRGEIARDSSGAYQATPKLQQEADSIREKNRENDISSILASSPAPRDSLSIAKAYNDSGRNIEAAKEELKSVTQKAEERSSTASEIKRQNKAFERNKSAWANTEGTTGSKRNEISEDGSYHWEGHVDDDGNWVSGLAEWTQDNETRLQAATDFALDGNWHSEEEMQVYQQEAANLYYDNQELESYVQKQVDEFKAKYDQSYASASAEEKKNLDATLKNNEDYLAYVKGMKEQSKSVYDTLTNNNEYFGQWDEVKDVEAYVNDASAYKDFGGTPEQLRTKLEAAELMISNIEGRQKRHKSVGLSEEDWINLKSARKLVQELPGENGLIAQAEAVAEQRRQEAEEFNRNQLYSREYAVKINSDGSIGSYSLADWKEEEARLETMLKNTDASNPSYTEIANKLKYIRDNHTKGDAQEAIRAKYASASDEEINAKIRSIEFGEAASKPTVDNSQSALDQARKDLRALESKALTNPEEYLAAQKRVEELEIAQKASVETPKLEENKERTYTEQLELDTLREIQAERVNANVVQNYKDFQDKYGAEGAMQWQRAVQSSLSEQQRNNSAELAHWNEAAQSLGEYYVIPKTSDFADVRAALKEANISEEDTARASSFIQNHIREIQREGNLKTDGLKYELAVATVARDMDLSQAKDYQSIVEKAKDKYSIDEMRTAFSSVQDVMYDINGGISDGSKSKGILSGLGITGEDADRLIEMITTYGLDVSYLTPTDENSDPNSIWALGGNRGSFTEQQKNNWYYLLEHDGAVAAAEYALSINNVLNSEYRSLLQENRAADLAYVAEHHKGEFIGGALASPVVTPFMGMTSPIDYIRLRDQVNRLGTDIVNPTPSIAEYGNMITELYTNQISDSAGKFAGFANFAYGVYGSTIQSVEVAATGGLLGKAIGLSDSLTILGKGAQNLAAGMFSDLTFFSGAAVQSYHDFRKRGIDPQRALTAATWSGIAEAAFEHVSFEKLYHAKDVFDWTSWKDWAVETAVSGAIEGSEEVFTSMANFLSEAAILGKDGSYWKSVEGYQELGLDRDTAMKKAMWDTVQGWAVDFAAGAVSGGISVGSSSAFNYKAYTNEINDSAKKLGERINKAKIEGDKTLAQKMGEYLGSYEYYNEADAVQPNKQQREELATLKSLAEKAAKGEATSDDLGQMVVLANRYDEKLMSDFVFANTKTFMAISPGLVIDSATKALNSVFGKDEAQKLLTAFYEHPDAFVEDSFVTGLKATLGDNFQQDELESIEYLMGYILTGNNAYTEEDLRKGIRNLITDENAQKFILTYFQDQISQFNQPKKRFTLFSKNADPATQPWFVYTTNENTLNGSFEDVLVNVWKGAKTASHYVTLQKQAMDSVKAAVDSLNDAVSKSSVTAVSQYRDNGDFFITKDKSGKNITITREVFIDSHKNGIDPITGEKSSFTDLMDDDRLNAEFDGLLQAAYLKGDGAGMVRYNLTTGKERTRGSSGAYTDFNMEDLRSQINEIDKQLEELYSKSEEYKAQGGDTYQQNLDAIKTLEARKTQAQADLKILEAREKVRQNGRTQSRNSGTSGRNANADGQRNAGGIPYRQVGSDGQNSGGSATVSTTSPSTGGSSGRTIQQVILQDGDTTVASMENGSVVYDSSDPKADKTKLTKDEQGVLQLAEDVGVDRLIFVDADQLYAMGSRAAGYFTTIDGKKTIFLNLNRGVVNGYHEAMHYMLSSYTKEEKQALLGKFITTIFNNKEEANAFLDRYDTLAHQQAYAKTYDPNQPGGGRAYQYVLFEEMLCDLWKGLNRYNIGSEQFTALQQKAYAFVIENQIMEHAKASRQNRNAEPPAEVKSEEKAETPVETTGETTEQLTTTKQNDSGISENPAKDLPVPKKKPKSKKAKVDQNPTVSETQEGTVTAEDAVTEITNTVVGLTREELAQRVENFQNTIRSMSDQELVQLIEDLDNLLREINLEQGSLPQQFFTEISVEIADEYNRRYNAAQARREQQAEETPTQEAETTTESEATTESTSESTGNPVQDEIDAILKDIAELDRSIADVTADRDRQMKAASDKDESAIIKGQANQLIKILKDEKKRLQAQLIPLRKQLRKETDKNRRTARKAELENNIEKGSKKTPNPKPETHIDNRTQKTVSKTNVNAFQYDNPEVKPFFKRAADILMRDLIYMQSSRRSEYGKGVVYGATNNFLERVSSYFGSLDKAIEACEAIINNHGGENFADPKRIELFLDEMLSNGYESISPDTDSISSSAEYLILKGSLEGGTPYDARQRAIQAILDSDFEHELTEEDAARIADDNMARTGYYDPVSMDGQEVPRAAETRNFEDVLSEIEEVQNELDELKNYANGERYHKDSDGWYDGSTGKRVSEDVAQAHYERIQKLEKRYSELTDLAAELDPNFPPPIDEYWGQVITSPDNGETVSRLDFVDRVTSGVDGFDGITRTPAMTEEEANAEFDQWARELTAMGNDHAQDVPYTVETYDIYGKFSLESLSNGTGYETLYQIAGTDTTLTLNDWIESVQRQNPEAQIETEEYVPTGNPLTDMIARARMENPETKIDRLKLQFSDMVESGELKVSGVARRNPDGTLTKIEAESINAYEMRKSPLGHLITYAQQAGRISEEEADRQYGFLAELMKLLYSYDDTGFVWKVVGSEMFSAIKNNSDPQYGKTIDFSTICKKTQQIIDVISKTMKLLGSGLSKEEIKFVYKMVGEAGESTPCPVCYVFSRWMGLGSVLDNIKRYQEKYGTSNPNGQQEALELVKEVQKAAVAKMRRNSKLTFGKAVNAAQADVFAKMRTAELAFKDYEEAAKKPNLKKNRNILFDADGNFLTQDYWAEQISHWAQEYDKYDAYKWAIKTRLVNADLLVKSSEDIATKLRNKYNVKGNTAEEVLENAGEINNASDEFVELYNELSDNLKDLGIVDADRLEKLRQKYHLKKAQSALKGAVTKALKERIKNYSEYRKTHPINIPELINLYNNLDEYDAIVNELGSDSFVFNKKYKDVPEDILFDLNKGEEFAKYYPETWTYRTTRGSGLGKAIMPYSDARVGEIIQGVALGNVSGIKIGDDNAFLDLLDPRKGAQAQKILNTARKKMAAQNLIGGMRFQSTSDFRYEYASDYLLAFFEMQAMGANVQLYTKVLEAVDFFASVGCDVNLSVMPRDKGLGVLNEKPRDWDTNYDRYYVQENGKYVKLRKGESAPEFEPGRYHAILYSDVTGVNGGAAREYVQEYDNVQMIMVGISADHINACLDSDDITFVIPFHGSGNSTADIQQLMQLLGESIDKKNITDFTEYQIDFESKDANDGAKAARDLRYRIVSGALLDKNGKIVLTDEDINILDGNKFLSDLFRRFYLDATDANGNLDKKQITKNFLEDALRNINIGPVTDREFYNKYYLNGYNECYHNFLSGDAAKQIFPFEYWDKSLKQSEAKGNGDAFQAYCKSLGLVPRFSGWTKKGKYDANLDFTKNDNYWKLLIDRKMYDNRGNYRAQRQINLSNVDVFSSSDISTQRESFGFANLNPRYGDVTFGNGSEFANRVNPRAEGKDNSVISKINDPRKSDALAQICAKGIRDTRAKAPDSNRFSNNADIQQAMEAEDYITAAKMLAEDPNVKFREEDGRLVVAEQGSFSLDAEQLDEYRPQYIEAIQQMRDRTEAEEFLDNDTWHQSHQALADLFHQVPDLDYLSRLANATTAKEKKQIRAEFEQLLSGINDRDALWQLGAYSIYASYGVWNGLPANGFYQKLKSAKRLFGNIVEARRDQILVEAGESTNIRLQDREYTLAEVRNMFDQLNKDQAIADLANKVFPVAETLGLTIRGRNGKRFKKSTVYGHAYGSVVEYNINRFNDLGVTDQQKASVLLHELIHSCTSYALTAYERPALRIQLSPDMMEAAGTIHDIWSQIAGDPAFRNMYGTTNSHEMLAELSEPKFREAMEHKSLWDKLVDAIKHFFGIGTNNALDSASVALDYLLDNVDYEAYLKYAETYNRSLDTNPLSSITRAADAVNAKIHPGEVQLWNGRWVAEEYATNENGYWDLRDGYTFDPVSGHLTHYIESEDGWVDMETGELFYVDGVGVYDKKLSDTVTDSNGNTITEGSFSLDRDGIASVTYFAGSGTLDYALRDRLMPLLAVEYDPEIRDMFVKNNGNAIMVTDADVNDVNPGAVIAGHVDYFHASPVCKNFSRANNKSGETEMDRNFARSIVKAIRAWQPRVFTLENVRGYQGSDSLKMVTDILDELGYKWDVDVYRASDYGAATIRDRLFVRAVRDGDLPKKPVKTHEGHEATWWDAIADIIDTLPVMDESGLTDSRRARLKKMKIDINNLTQPILLLSGTKGGEIQYAYADKPAPTLMTKGDESRIILTDGTILKVTPEVYARIQGLDGDFQLPMQKRNKDVVHQTNAFKIIGNGVPAQLTQAIVNPLLDTISDQSNMPRPIRPEDNGGVSPNIAMAYYKDASDPLGGNGTAAELFDRFVLRRAGDEVTPFIYASDYNHHSAVAKGIKAKDGYFLSLAAEDMAPLVPHDAVLIPIPNRHGYADDTLALAQAIAERYNATHQDKVEVADILKGNDRPSQYETKKKSGKSLKLEDFGTRLVGEVPEGKFPVFIDNVVASGATATAAQKAVGGGMTLAFAYGDRTKPSKGLKFADPITYDDDGNPIPLNERFNPDNPDPRYSVEEDWLSTVTPRYKQGETFYNDVMNGITGYNDLSGAERKEAFDYIRNFRSRARNEENSRFSKVGTRESSRSSDYEEIGFRAAFLRKARLNDRKNQSATLESLPVITEDETGRTLPKAVAEFFRNSKLRDALGRLRIFYHGTSNLAHKSYDYAYSDDGLTMWLSNSPKTTASYSNSARIASYFDPETGPLYFNKQLNYTGTAEMAETLGSELSHIAKEAFDQNRLDIDQQANIEDASLKLYYIANDIRDGNSEPSRIRRVIQDLDGAINDIQTYNKNALDIAERIQPILDMARLFSEEQKTPELGTGANVPTYVNMENPFTIDAKGKAWNEIVIPSGVEDTLEDLGYSPHRSRYTDDPTARTRQLAMYAYAMGYDGVVIENVIDYGGKAVNGVKREMDIDYSEPSTVIAVFNSNQVKDIRNEHPTENEDYRFSLDIDPTSTYDAFGDELVMDFEALEDERQINSLRSQIEELGDAIDVELDDGVERTLRNKLIKAQYELDKLVRKERSLTKKTSINDILENLDSYRYSDLESIAQQYSQSNWDIEPGTSKEQLASELREVLTEYAADLSMIERQNPRYGFSVRPVNTTAPQIIQFQGTKSALSDNLYYSSDESTAYYQTPTGETVVLNNVGPDSPEAQYINYLEAMQNANSSNTTAAQSYTIPPAARYESNGYNIGESNDGLRRGTEEVPSANQERTLRPAGSNGERYEQSQSQSAETEGVSRYSVEEDPAGRYATLYDPDTDTFVNEDGDVVATDDMYPIGSFTREIFKAMKSGDMALKNVEDIINSLMNRQYNLYEEDINTVRNMIQINDAITPQQKEALYKAMDELVKRYGGMRTAEEDKNKDVQFAKKTSEGKTIMKFTQTVARNADQEWLTDEAVRMALTDEAMSYTPMSNEEAIRRAQQRFDRAGSYEKALAEWDGFVRSEHTPKQVDIAFGELLLQQAAAEGRINDAVKLTSDLTILAHYTGQTLQAFRILKKMTPRGQLYYLQSVVNDLNKKYDSRIKSGKMGTLTLNQALVAQLLSSSTREELDTAVERIKKDLAEHIPATWMDQWNAWRYLAMLGNPRTHIRNLIGNAAFMPAVFMKDMLARQLENKFVDPALRMRKAGADLSKDSAYMKRAEQDFEVMAKIIAGEAGGNKFSDIQDILGQRQIFKWGLLDKLEKLNGKALSAEDMGFMHTYYTRAFAEALQAGGIKEADVQSFDTTREGRKTLNEIRNWAMIEAQRNTYHDANVLASTLNQLKAKSPVAYVILEGLVPFTKTPANILKRGIEYSPIGLISSSIKLAQDLRSGEYTTSQCIDRFAAGWTGTAFLALGYLLAKGFLGFKLRGEGPDDDKEADFETLQGHQPWSLEFGKYSFTIDWMAPIALPLFCGQVLYSTLHGEHPDLTDTDNWMFLLKLADPMLSLSMLDGIENTLSSVASAKDTSRLGVLGISMFGSYIAQGMSTFLGQIARATDKDRRSTFIQEDSKNSALNRFVQKSILSKLPDVGRLFGRDWYPSEENKMAFVDAWGRTDSSNTVLSTIWKVVENFVSPGYGNIINQTPVDAELQRLYESTGENTVFPTTGAKYWNYGEGDEKVQKNLTKEEYEDFAKTRGQTAHEMLAQMFSSEMYQDATDLEKIKMIANVYSYADKYAKSTITPEYELDKWMDVAQKIGPVDYILIKTEYEDNKSNEKIFSWLASNPNLNEDQVATLIADKYNMPDNIDAFEMPGYLYELNGNDEDSIKAINESVVAQRLKELKQSDAWKNAEGDTITQGRLLREMYENAKTETALAYSEALSHTDRVRLVGKASSLGSEAFSKVLELSKDEQIGFLSEKYRADATLHNPLHEGYDVTLSYSQRQELQDRFKAAWGDDYDALINSKEFKNAPNRQYQENMIADAFNKTSAAVEEAYVSELYQNGLVTEKIGTPNRYTDAESYRIATELFDNPTDQATWLAQRISSGSAIDDPDRPGYQYRLTTAQSDQIEEEIRNAFIPRYEQLVNDPDFNTATSKQQAKRVKELMTDVSDEIMNAYARQMDKNGYGSLEYDKNVSRAEFYEYIANESGTSAEKKQIFLSKYSYTSIADPKATEYHDNVYFDYIDANWEKYYADDTAEGYEKLHKAALDQAAKATKAKYGTTVGKIPDPDYSVDYYADSIASDLEPAVDINAGTAHSITTVGNTGYTIPPAEVTRSRSDGAPSWEETLELNDNPDRYNVGDQTTSITDNYNPNGPVYHFEDYIPAMTEEEAREEANWQTTTQNVQIFPSAVDENSIAHDIATEYYFAYLNNPDYAGQTYEDWLNNHRDFTMTPAGRRTYSGTGQKAERRGTGLTDGSSASSVGGASQNFWNRLIRR